MVGLESVSSASCQKNTLQGSWSGGPADHS